MEERGMGLFEEQPWLLVPLILVVTIAYDLTKTVVMRWTRRFMPEHDDPR
jgi:hypothetical protein